MYRVQRAAGMALVALVLLIASVFMLMSAGAGDTVLMGQKQASRAQYARRTNYAAYGAMQMALDKLTSDLTYGIDPAEVGQVPGDPELVYELSIYNNYLGNFTNPAPDGRWVPKYMVYIKAKCDFRAYPGKYTSTLFSKGYVGGQASDYAIVGTESVNVTNSLVDSWWINQRDIPPYGNRRWLLPSVSGRITTNSIHADGLVLAGNTSVNASLKWGPSGNEATVLKVLDTAVWNPGGSTYLTKGASTFPVRVPRYHPPRDPKGATSDLVSTTPGPIPPGDYRSLTILNNSSANLTMPASLPNPPYDNKYYVATNVTIVNSTVNLVGATGAIPCDIYIGRGFSATNSTINWANAPSPNLPPDKPGTPHPSHDALGQQELLGPRTMRIFFVGSGAPKFTDCDFVADNCKMSLHASGKAMRVLLRNGTILWGGVKGFKVTLTDSILHYHRVFTD